MPTADINPGGRVALTQMGPTLPVQIGFDAAFDPVSRPYTFLAPDLYPGLIDTGASESCIDSTLASNLGLPVIDRRPVAGVHGAQPVSFHLAQVYVPALDFTIFGTFASVDLAAGGQQHMALLGRTFLEYHTMTYDGPNGMVTLSR